MNINKLTGEYINGRPSIRSCLKKGLINYSSLAREIAGHHSLNLKKNFDAILIACRRYKDKLLKTDNESEIRELLAKSKLEVKNKIMTVVFEKRVPRTQIELIEKDIIRVGGIFRLIEGATAYTLIISDEFAPEVDKIFKAFQIEQRGGLVEVIFKSTKAIENLPGVMAYICSRLADAGVNIVETMSCWTDTILVVEEKDLGKVMEVLRF